MPEQNNTQTALDIIKQGLASVQTQDWNVRVQLNNAVSIIEQELAKVPASNPKK